MRSLLVLAVLLVAAPAHAMGVYITFDLVAWNTDGTAALLHRTTTSSGEAGRTHDYLVVAAGSAQPLMVTFDDTRDPAAARQKIDRIECMRLADELGQAITELRFRGVLVERRRCKDRSRLVVGVTAAATRAAVGSEIVVRDGSGPRDLRDLRARDAVRALGDDAIDAFALSLTGALVIVFSGENGDSSPRAEATVFEATKSGVARRADDLRHLATSAAPEAP